MQNTSNKLILGLDIGTASIGWCLSNIHETKDADGKSYLEDFDIQAMGSRIFPEPVNPKDNKILNKARQTQRSSRKVLRRRRGRLNALIAELQKIDLLPQGIVNSEYLEKLGKDFSLSNPYELRLQALETKLEPYNLGRVLVHIAQRRGFKSNAKRKPKDGGEDPKKTLIKLEEEITDLKEQRKELKKEGTENKDLDDQIKEKEEDYKNLQESLGEFYKSGKETIGAWLHSIQDGTSKIRGKKHFRSSLHAEFVRILEKQAEYYPSLTQDLITKLDKEIVFMQRPLKDCSHLVVFCSFEPGKRCVSKAHYLFQEFSVLQDINNLKFVHGKKKYPLSGDEVRQIAGEVMDNGSLSPTRIKELCKKPSDWHLEFFHKTTKKDLSLPTTQAFHKILQSKSKWTEHKKDLMALYEIVKEDDFEKKLAELAKKLPLTQEQVEKIRNLELKNTSQYASISLACIEKIRPKLLEGKRYDEAVTEVYGSHSSLGTIEWDKNYLPSLIELDLLKQKMLEAFKSRSQQQGKAKPRYVPSITNPTVIRALTELRKLVNDIVKNHLDGDPKKLHQVKIELARDLALSKENREKIEKQQKERQDKNKKAEDELTNMGIDNPSRDDIQKLNLWKQVGKQCAYCFTPLESTSQFMQNCEVEHIVPVAQLPDNSFDNKTIACQKCNAEKSGLTPFQKWGKTARWRGEVNDGILDTYLQAIEDKEEWIEWKKNSINSKKKAGPEPKSHTGLKFMPLRKLKRILTGDQSQEQSLNDLVAGFSTRQLNDTRYISKQAVDYLRILFKDTPSKKNPQETIRMVETVKGGATALLRSVVGNSNEFLFRVVSQDKEGEQEKLEDAKNRKDHRHHALDAFFISLSSPSINQRIARRAQEAAKLPGKDTRHLTQNLRDFFGEKLMKKIHEQLTEKMEEITISHTSKRKISGSLHKDTAYGTHNEVSINHISENLFVKLKKDKYINNDVVMALQEFMQSGEFTNEIVGTRRVKSDNPFANAIAQLSHRNVFSFKDAEGCKEYTNSFPLQKPLFTKKAKLDNLEKTENIVDPQLKALVDEYIHKRNVVNNLEKSIGKKIETSHLYRKEDSLFVEHQQAAEILGINRDISYEDLREEIKAFQNTPCKHPSGKPIKAVQIWVFSSEMFVPQSAPYKALEYGNNHHLEIFYRETQDKKGNPKTDYIALSIPTLCAAELIRRGFTHKRGLRIDAIGKNSPYLGSPGCLLKSEWVEAFGVDKTQKKNGKEKPQEFRFLCSLHQGDLIDWQGDTPEECGIYMYEKLATASLIIQLHTSSFNPEKERTNSIQNKKKLSQKAIISKSSNQLDALRGLYRISPSGKLHYTKLPNRQSCSE